MGKKGPGAKKIANQLRDYYAPEFAYLDQQQQALLTSLGLSQAQNRSSGGGGGGGGGAAAFPGWEEDPTNLALQQAMSDLQRKGLNVDMAELTKNLDFLKKEGRLAELVKGIQTGQAYNSYNRDKRAQMSDATARGAVATQGNKEALDSRRRDLVSQTRQIQTDWRQRQDALDKQWEGIHFQGQRVGLEGEGVGLEDQMRAAKRDYAARARAYSDANRGGGGGGGGGGGSSYADARTQLKFNNQQAELDLKRQQLLRSIADQARGGGKGRGTGRIS